MYFFYLNNLVIVASLFAIISVQSVERCDNYARAGATLNFVKCQEALFYNSCNDKEFLDVSCVGFSSSCEYLQTLTTKCGSVYGLCYTMEEQRQIMKMWVRQFIRELVRYPGEFVDNGMEIMNGDCLNNTVNTFMDQFEVEQIKSMIITEENHKLLNLTCPMYVVYDKDGSERQVYDHPYSKSLSLPSFWGWCQWKLNKYKDKEFYKHMSNLYRCDGKCNNNTGDNQVWKINSLTYMEWDPVKKDFIGNGGDHFSDYIHEEPLKSIFHIPLDVQFGLNDADFTNYDQGRMTMCRGFKILIDNLTEPVERCLGEIQVREVVWGHLLQRIDRYIHRLFGVAERVTGKTQMLGDFTYRVEIVKCLGLEEQ